MRKMAVLISSHSAAKAEQVMKKAKESLGLKKGAYVLNHNGFKACFVSNLVQKSMDNVSGLDKYKDYDMLILQTMPETVKATPAMFDIKIHVNNNLGYSVYICAVPQAKELSNTDNVAADVCDVIRMNLGI